MVKLRSQSRIHQFDVSSKIDLTRTSGYMYPNHDGQGVITNEPADRR